MNRFEKAQEDYKKELANLENLNLEEETLEVTINSFGIKIINTTSANSDNVSDNVIEALEEN